MKAMETKDFKARLLVVEDDPHIQLLLSHLLRPGFDVEMAVTVDDALSRVKRRRFDLFLIDINLGGHRTGVDLLTSLREMPGYHDTPAVSCTAYALRGDRERFLDFGFDEHIQKPFKPRQLRQLLESMVHQPLAV